MLLQRLKEHADRNEDTLPPPFYRVRPVRWTIDLLPDGTPAVYKLQDRADSDHPAGPPMPVPYIWRSGSRPSAMLLADELRYVLDFNGDDAERIFGDPGRRNHDFIELVKRWRDSAPGDPAAAAVVSFFERGLHLKLGIPEETAKPTDIVAIRIEGEWAHQRESSESFWVNVVLERKGSDREDVCLVCGQASPLLDTIPEAVKARAIPAGSGQGRDAQLISVNKPAQGRGGKIQLAAAPVCGKCGSSVMSALNLLLSEDKSRYRTDDSVLTWWLRSERDYPWTDWLDNPQPGQVKKLIAELHAPRPGSVPGGVDMDAFHAVTLSVNQSRVVVRDWIEKPLGKVQRNLGRWFTDHRVTDPWKDGLQPVPLWLMALSAGRWAATSGQERYQSKMMPHGCKRDLALAALNGTRPSAYLLPHLLQRIRADGRIDSPRAALLRLILIRSAKDPEEDYMAGLDPDLPIVPYQCGRMFAVLEQIQRTALGRDINTTIADKYLPAATATPLAILTMLRRNANGHLKRVRRSNEGAYYALSSRLDEVIEHIPGEHGIPAALTLDGQAEFILGYHHQRAFDITAARARSAEKKNGPTDTGDSE